MCARHYSAAEAAAAAAAARAAEMELWRLAESAQQSATPRCRLRAGRGQRVGGLAGQLLRGVGSAYADRPGRAGPAARTAPAWHQVGVLSNTMWPRAAHERIFIRDEVFDLIDGAVYSSEIPGVKPHQRRSGPRCEPSV